MSSPMSEGSYTCEHLSVRAGIKQVVPEIKLSLLMTSVGR